MKFLILYFGLQGKEDTAVRKMEFKMERQGLIEIGQEVEIREGKLPTLYYYVIEPAVAMSGNYTFGERLKSRTGKIIDIKETEKGFYVEAEFDE